MARTLLSAVKSGNLVLAKTILNKHLYGNIDSQDPRQDGTALFWACSNGFCELVHLLIFHGANLEACTAWHATPLHASADNNHLHIARLLIRLGANGNKKTIYGDTPCHLAAYRGHKQMVQMLVELGDVDLNLTNSKNRTSLDESILGSHSHVTNYICRVMSQKNSIPIQISDHLMTEMSLDLTEENNSLNQNETNSHSSKEMLSYHSFKSQENQSVKELKTFETVSQTSSPFSDEGNNIDCSFSITPPSSIFSLSFPNFDQNLSDFNYLSDSSTVSSVIHSCNSSSTPNFLDNNIFLNDLSSTSSPHSDSICNMNFMNILAIKC